MWHFQFWFSTQSQNFETAIYYGICIAYLKLSISILKVSSLIELHKQYDLLEFIYQNFVLKPLLISKK
jgi:hypothetical protein